jgi:hypothetical protein
MSKDNGEQNQNGSSLMEKVFRSTLGEGAWQQHLGREANFKEDEAKFAAMTNEALAETVALYLRNCERPRWSRGEPVYDAVMVHNLIPEMIRRLRD